MSIDKVMQTAGKFYVKFDEDYHVKIKNLVYFESGTPIQDLILENKLNVIEDRFKSQLDF